MKTEKIKWIKIKRARPIVTNQIKCNRQWIEERVGEKKKLFQSNGQVPVSTLYDTEYSTNACIRVMRMNYEFVFIQPFTVQ